MTVLSICSEKDPVLPSSPKEALGEWTNPQSSSETVHDLIETMSQAHHEKTDCPQRIFSLIHAALSAHKDTLQERCLLLAMSILDGMDLTCRLWCPTITVIFLLNYRITKEKYPEALKNEEKYLGLFQKEQWNCLLDDMKISSTNVPRCGCLGPVRPSEAQDLLFAQSIANSAFRTFLSIEPNGIEIRLRTKCDLRIWKEYCSSTFKARVLQRRNIDKIEVDSSLFYSFVQSRHTRAICRNISYISSLDKLVPGYKGYLRR